MKNFIPFPSNSTIILNIISKIFLNFPQKYHNITKNFSMHTVVYRLIEENYPSFIRYELLNESSSQTGKFVRKLYGSRNREKHLTSD